MSEVKVSIDNVSQLSKAILEEAAPQIITELCRFAKEELLSAYNNSTYAKDKTQNLADSYVWGVYYKGKLQQHGFLTSGKKATQPRRVSYTNKSVFGRDEAQTFISSYKPQTNMFEVIFAAEMYYGSYLEGGTKRNKKYIVLSSIINSISQYENLTITFNKTYPDGTPF